MGGVGGIVFSVKLVHTAAEFETRG